MFAPFYPSDLKYFIKDNKEVEKLIKTTRYVNYFLLSFIIILIIYTFIYIMFTNL
jgi:hypothetical protein